jgi:hypothetical protein
MRRSAASWNDVMEVTVATAGRAISIIAMTTSGRITMTEVIIATTTSAKKKQEDKIPSDRGNKAFKPCSTHRPKSKHTSKECYKSLKNQNKCQTHNKKCQYKEHHNNACYTSNNDELRFSANTPVPSEDPAVEGYKLPLS